MPQNVFAQDMEHRGTSMTAVPSPVEVFQSRRIRLVVITDPMEEVDDEMTILTLVGLIISKFLF